MLAFLSLLLRLYLTERNCRHLTVLNKLNKKSENYPQTQKNKTRQSIEYNALDKTKRISSIRVIIKFINTIFCIL